MKWHLKAFKLTYLYIYCRGLCKNFKRFDCLFSCLSFRFVSVVNTVTLLLGGWQCDWGARSKRNNDEGVWSLQKGLFYFEDIYIYTPVQQQNSAWEAETQKVYQAEIIPSRNNISTWYSIPGSRSVGQLEHMQDYETKTKKLIWDEKQAPYASFSSPVFFSFHLILFVYKHSSSASLQEEP